MPRKHPRTGAFAGAMLAGAALGALPAIATEANVDVDSGVEDPAKPINPTDALVDVDAGNRDVDVSVDRDPALRMPQGSKPDVSVEAPGADVTIDRN
jgi:hypothetical protein